MTDGYRTVFEVSYLSNGILLLNVTFLFVGLFVPTVVTLIRGRMPESEAREGEQTYRYFLLIAVVWIGIGTLWLFKNLHSGYDLTHAVRSRYCRVVEGKVEVISRQPHGGHGGQENIRIAGKDFGFSYYGGKLGYSRTISHGGWLTDGVNARLRYIGNTIVKVEVRPESP